MTAGITLTVPSQVRSGNRVPGDFDFVSGCEASDVGFVHESAHANFREIRLLQHQVAGIEVSALLHWQRIDDPIERSPNIQLTEQIFSRTICGLGLRFLGFHSSHFWLRITIFLLLQKQIEISIGSFELILGVFYLAR